jgi:hypothetical protein
MALIAALHVVVLTVVAVKISPATGRSTLIDNFETGEAPAKRRINTNRNSKRRSCATPTWRGVTLRSSPRMSRGGRPATIPGAGLHALTCWWAHATFSVGRGFDAACAAVIAARQAERRCDRRLSTSTVALVAA